MDKHVVEVGRKPGIWVAALRNQTYVHMAQGDRNRLAVTAHTAGVLARNLRLALTRVAGKSCITVELAHGIALELLSTGAWTIKVTSSQGATKFSGMCGLAEVADALEHEAQLIPPEVPPQ